MTSFKCTSRAVIAFSAILLSACATSSYQPRNYLSARSDLRCPAGTVVMCKHVDSARECGCAETAMFWSQ